MRDFNVYLRAFAGDWISLMSGIASVVLALIGAIKQTPLPYWYFWVTAATGFFYASYRVWLREHRGTTLQQSEKIRQERQEQIGRWRGMVSDVAQQNNGDVAFFLERHSEFYSLKPHLREATIQEILAERTLIVGSTVPAAVHYLVDDIAELEKKWGLR